MKIDRNGIQFRFWLSFFSLSVGITLLMGLLQIGFIRPYYRNGKIASVSSITDTLQTNLIENSAATNNEVKDVLTDVVENNACIVVYNERRDLLYQADGLGSSCLFLSGESDNGIDFQDGATLIAMLNNDSFSQNVQNVKTQQEMIVYGKVLRENLANYYIFVNSPLEPIDSVVTFFSRQYMLYTIVVIIVASVVSVLISRSVTQPIVKMKEQAAHLANADYSVKFNGGQYTETQELAETLNNTAEQLSKIETLRRDLLANVSHDIRTPLTDIRAYAEMIRDVSGNDPLKREKHLNVILRETDYMNRLINDISDLSKMQSGNTVLHWSNCDLAELIRDNVEMNESLLNRSQITLHMDVPDTLTIYADEIQIERVVANFLSNAIKHSKPGGNIWITAQRLADEETVKCSVRDDGEGIPKDELPYIWDRYYKSGNSFHRSMTSTGLGLSISKAILTAHGAQYGVESEEGKGSTFWFSLREKDEA